MNDDERLTQAGKQFVPAQIRIFSVNKRIFIVTAQLVGSPCKPGVAGACALVTVGG